FAAAAITGGNPFRTMMLTWKYTLPAFLVPFLFTLTPNGVGVLLHGSPANIVSVIAGAMVGVAALAVALGGWGIREASRPERVLCGAGGLLLFHGSAATTSAGLALVVIGA